MKSKGFMNLFFLLLAGISIFPVSLYCQSDPKEEKLWSGSLSIDYTEDHHFSITKASNNNSRTHTREHTKSQRVTVFIKAADIFTSGTIKAEGTHTVNTDSLDFYKNELYGGEWSTEKTTFTARGSDSLKDGDVLITLAKKSDIDAAKQIQAEIGACGVDPACLAAVLAKYEGITKDTASSFPIKIVVQVVNPCEGIITSSKVTEKYTRNKGTETEEETSPPLQTYVGIPLAVEMDGTYTRGKNGDRITASYNESEKQPYKALDGQDHPGIRHVTCSLFLTNGPPEVRIFAETKEDQKDITDKETKVMAGQRLHLTAHVVSTGLGDLLSSTWKVPGVLFDSWRGSRDAGYIRLVDNDEFEHISLHYAWGDGSSGGKRYTVSYNADYAGNTLEGKTTFVVFIPEATADVTPGTKTDFSDGSEQGNSASLPSSGCEIAPIPYGIQIKSEVAMPSNELNNGEFTLQYVQLVETNAWGMFSPDKRTYSWKYNVHTSLLDSAYPYEGPVSGSGRLSLSMRDTPGSPSLIDYDAVYIDMDFNAYLMFKPPDHPELATIPQFISLYKINWHWKAAVQAVTPHPNSYVDCGKGIHIITCDKPPSSYPHVPLEWYIQPEWEGVSSVTLKSWNEGTVPTHPSDPPPGESGWNNR
jgi:hypothetical protein